VLAAQVSRLVAVAEPSPFGRGLSTFVDPDVRRCWQVGAERVQFTGRTWPDTLSSIVKKATAGLGVSGAVQADFYKLLIYEEGGFFLEHRDTEKADGMFATLVVVLPGSHEGGELVIRHKDEEVVLDLCPTDPGEVHFAASFADCRHEVRPVRCGARLVLIFNLCRSGRPPEPPSWKMKEAQLATLLANWGPEDPTKLIVPLEHAVTKAALGLDKLKGADAARAAVMARAAYKADCDLHLALVTVEEDGWAEYHGNYRRRTHWGDDDADFEIGEVTDSAQFLSDWQQTDGTAVKLGPLPFDQSEVVPPEFFDEIEPLSLSFNEATGNEGASFERLYRVAALVLWPKAERLRVLAAGGVGVTLPALAQLVDVIERQSSSRSEPEAVALAHRIIDDWPPAFSGPALPTSEFLEVLLRLGNLQFLRRFIVERLALGCFVAGDASAMAGGLVAFPDSEASLLASSLLTSDASLSARSALLAAMDGFEMRSAVQAFVDHLANQPHDRNEWGHVVENTDDLVVQILEGVMKHTPDLTDVAVGHMLVRPSVWKMDRALVPAAVRLNHTVPAMRAAVITHLDERMSRVLLPPQDWARPAKIRCSCQWCRQLSEFLADPQADVWLMRAKEEDRKHVERAISSAKAQVDRVTIRKGSPHTLECTKNQAEYDHLCKQREKDKNNYAILMN
jgi:hypothetical protein